MMINFKILLKLKIFSLILGSLVVFLEQAAYALPAFALREKLSCTACHTNGSAPHLTKLGCLYRRAGFRFIDTIGKKELDDQHMNLTEHLNAGTNLDYQYSNSTPPGAASSTMTDNHFAVREVELWPVVGAFLGNFAAWTELDATPTASTNAGGVVLNQADLRYITGNKDFFFNFRGGMIALEGYGASDQWLDDGNIPLFDQLSSYFNQDTLVAPLGAMSMPQLGVEFGFNAMDSHLTIGVYNGFASTGGSIGGTSPAPSSGLVPATMNQVNGFSKDYKIQLDQFLWELGAITAVYYNGYIPMTADATGSFPWSNRYQQYRLYLTGFVVPNFLDVVAGGSLNANEYVTTSATLAGTFSNKGAFVRAFVYPMPHMSLAGRLDYYGYNSTPNSNAEAHGYSLQASLPFENNLFIFHWTQLYSNLSVANASAGLNSSFRAEWRFLF